MPKFHRKAKKLPTQEQIEANKALMQKIREILAEKGYRIFNLAVRFKLSEFDFLATPTTAGSGSAMMIRIAPSGFVQFRFYTTTTKQTFTRILGGYLKDEQIEFGLPLPDVEKRSGYAAFVAKGEIEVV